MHVWAVCSAPPNEALQRGDMTKKYVSADFDQMNWHDSPLYGFFIRPSDPDENDWRSDLILDIDYLEKWTEHHTAPLGTRSRAPT